MKRLLKRKVDKWVWAEFLNNAGEDNFKLRHWAKEKDKDLNYPFEKVNYKPEIVSYDDKEYEEHLRDLNPGWSGEETDYLWSLLGLYDLRFIVIQDGYDFHGNDRSVEEIKNRYYSCAKLLLETRKMEEHPICQGPYNFEYEVRRKYNLDKLFLRTKS